MLILFFIVFIDLVGFGIIIPLLPFYAEFHQATPAMVGLVMATYSLTQFIAAPFWGRLSDRVGRRPVLLISLAGATASYVLLGFADTMWMLFAARAAGGAMAGNISAAFAYVADVTSRENRAKGMGMIRQALTRPNVGLLIGLTFLATFVFSGLESTFAMLSRRQFGWGPEQNGYLFAFVGLLGAAVQGGMIGPLVKRFGEARLIIQGAAALAIGVLLIPFSTNLPMLIAAMVIAGYGFSVISPSLNSLISLQVGEDEQGGIMGVTRSASTMGRFIGPAWAGFLFGALGRDWPYFGGAIVMLGVVLLGLNALKSLERPAEIPPG